MAWYWWLALVAYFVVGGLSAVAVWSMTSMTAEPGGLLWVAGAFFFWPVVWALVLI